MKNTDLSQRIKDLRAQLGYSQAELADKAQLSLRTVQRIENGEAKARGYTLQSIAKALNITSEELIVWEEKSDKLFLVTLNLSALSFVMFPLLGIFVPLMLWVPKKNELRGSNEMARALLNFQITWNIIFITGYVVAMIVGIGFTGTIFTFNNYLIVFGSLYMINIIFIIVNAIRVQQNRPASYFLAIRFLR